MHPTTTKQTLSSKDALETPTIAQDCIIIGLRACTNNTMPSHWAALNVRFFLQRFGVLRPLRVSSDSFLQLGGLKLP